MQRTSRFSTQARDARIASLVQEAGGLPAIFAVRHRKLRQRIVQTPARRTGTSALMTVTQEPSRIMAAQQSGMPMLRTSRFSTQARDAWIVSLVQEAGAACRIRCTPPHAAEAARSHGCRKQPRVARRASTVGWPRNAASTPFGLVGRDMHDQQMVSAQGDLLPKSGPEGCRRCPMRGDWFPVANNLPPYSRSLHGRDKVTTQRPRKPVKTWTDQDVGRLFFWERNPVKTFPMRNAVGVFLAVPNSITKPLANTTCAAWRRGCAIETRPAPARSVCTPAVPRGIARQRLHSDRENALQPSSTHHAGHVVRNALTATRGGPGFPARGGPVFSHGRGCHDPSFGLLAVRTHDRVQKNRQKLNR